MTACKPTVALAFFCLIGCVTTSERGQDLPHHISSLLSISISLDDECAVEYAVQNRKVTFEDVRDIVGKCAELDRRQKVIVRVLDRNITFADVSALLNVLREADFKIVYVNNWTVNVSSNAIPPHVVVLPTNTLRGVPRTGERMHH